LWKVLPEGLEVWGFYLRDWSCGRFYLRDWSCGRFYLRDWRCGRFSLRACGTLVRLLFWRVTETSCGRFFRACSTEINSEKNTLYFIRVRVIMLT
jgi:hypothetical protein